MEKRTPWLKWMVGIWAGLALACADEPGGIVTPEVTPPPEESSATAGETAPPTAAETADPSSPPSPTLETTPSPPPTGVVSPTEPHTPTSADTPTPLVTPTPSDPPTSTATPTETPTPSAPPTSTATPTPTPTATPIPPEQRDDDGDGYTEVEGDCNDGDPDISPEMVDQPYDGIDQDCDGVDLTDVDGDGHDAEEVGGDDCDDDDEDTYSGAQEVPYDAVDQDCSGSDLSDVDGDGFNAVETGSGDDCDDDNFNTYPGASEYADGTDNNCNGAIDEGLSTTDDDGDGYSEAQGDCDDSAASVNPDASEVAYDGVDQDCSGTDLSDVDGDGFSGIQVTGGSDCNDQDVSVNPAATEVCDSRDNDCDGSADEGVQSTFYQDSDQDGYGSSTRQIQACQPPPGYISTGGDCDDLNTTVHPGASEICNGIDEDCDNTADEGIKTYTYYRDQDDDGFGLSTDSITTCAAAPDGYVAVKGDCNDANGAVNPSASEICNSIDDNCNSSIDEGVTSTWYHDVDSDTYGSPTDITQACSKPSGYVSNNLDCDDTTPSVKPGATEVCNDKDDDCDTVKDDGVKLTFYLDNDGDTFGTPNTSVQACVAPTTYVSNNTDCNDANTAVNPGATEGVADSIDSTCDNLELCYVDRDNDGYRPDGTSTVVSTNLSCTDSGEATLSDPVGDCNDSSAAVYPGATEIRDGLDNNCDGAGFDGTYAPATSASLVGQVWEYTRVDIASGVTVTVTGANPLQMLAIQDVKIGGRLDLSGQNGGNQACGNTPKIPGGTGGGGGGFAGGQGGEYLGDYSTSLGTGGSGPGGGSPGEGNVVGATGGGGGYGANGSQGGTSTCGADRCGTAYSITGGTGGGAYGSQDLAVLYGGSGGGGGGFGGADNGRGAGGGGGGGAVKISAGTTLAVTGSITSNGGAGGSALDGCDGGTGGGGSGGSIWLVSPAVSISGKVEALGGAGGTAVIGGSSGLPGTGGSGAVGRIRIDTPSLTGISNPTPYRP